MGMRAQIIIEKCANSEDAHRICRLLYMYMETDKTKEQVEAYKKRLLNGEGAAAAQEAIEAMGSDIKDETSRGVKRTATAACLDTKKGKADEYSDKKRKIG